MEFLLLVFEVVEVVSNLFLSLLIEFLVLHVDIFSQLEASSVYVLYIYIIWQIWRLPLLSIIIVSINTIQGYK